METTTLSEINRLRQMSVADLQAEWVRLYGEPTRSRNRDYLFRRLAWRIQELQQGGLSHRAKARLAELSPAGFSRARPPRQTLPAVASAPEPDRRPTRNPLLPPASTVITKIYKDRELRVVVREDDFEFDGTMHTSLTALAKKITGCKSINGWLFFGLTTRKRA